MTSFNSDRVEELSAASSVLAHTGNITSWRKLRRKGVITTTDELASALEASLTSWLGRQSEPTPDLNEVLVRNTGLCQKVEEADNHVFTLKIFLHYWNPNLLRDAVHRALDELGLTKVNTIVLSFPSSPTNSKPSLDLIKPVWKEIEYLSQMSMAQSVGVADLDKEQLEELYEWAEMKPKVNQVNLAHCCTIPKDLQEFSKQHGIRLTTHNDDRDILPQDQLHSILGHTLKHEAAHPIKWNISWVARYSSVIKLRGIIAHKGYLLRLNNDREAE